LMNCIPQESASIPLMMHCMLEQVSLTVWSMQYTTLQDCRAK
jgi:hypothetical protein